MSSTSGIVRKKVSDLIGKRFNRLVVVEYLGKGKYNKHYWRCSCDCGGEVTLNTSKLSGNTSTKSCGCLRKETLLKNRADPTKHGLHSHPLYKVYSAMRQRCENPESQRWKYYGEKGIKVLWDTFPNFYEWALSHGYAKGLSIDRIDPNGNYEPSNCRWVTLEENTRHAHLGRSKKPS
jgi:hypothetical protein